MELFEKGLIGLFLLFMSGFHPMKQRYVDKTDHGRVNITKIINFSHSFSKVFIVRPWLSNSNILGVSKNQFKGF